jgi:hypothetical protein
VESELALILRLPVSIAMSKKKIMISYLAIFENNERLGWTSFTMTRQLATIVHWS